MKQRRGIRRFVIRASGFLLLGAIVNITVAWWCAIRLPSGQFDPWSRATQFRESGSPIVLTRHTDWGRHYFTRCFWTYRFKETVEVDGATFSSMYPSWSRCEDSELFVAHLDKSGTRWLTEQANGWPCLAMGSWHLWQFGPSLSVSEYHGSLKLAPLRAAKFALTRVPLLPIWPGFAINTLFYAAILWLLFVAPLALRRWRRINRGMCPACAYPVGTSDLCTECGKPVKGRSVEPAPS